MSIKLEAPWPNPSVISIFPNPQFSDVETADRTVTRQRSMNGMLYSYGRDDGTSKLTYVLSLNRLKALELKAFIETMIGQQIKLVNHKNETWIGFIDNNPFEITQARRAVGPTSTEYDTVSISFEGIKQ